VARTVAGLRAAYKDAGYPYSLSKATAEYIRSSPYKSCPIAGKTDHLSTPIAVYLSKKIYYPQADRWGSYALLNNKRDSISGEQFVQESRLLARQSKQNILLIFNERPRQVPANVVPVEEFTNSIVREDY